MEKERFAVGGGSMRGLRLSVCLAVLALFFCLGTGTCFSRDSAGLSGDISTYTGQAGSAQSQEGGSYLQVSRGWATECYSPTPARTRAVAPAAIPPVGQHSRQRREQRPRGGHLGQPRVQLREVIPSP